MHFTIAVYDWSLFTMPGALSADNIRLDTHSNDPSHPDYAAGVPTWIGETYMFNGGAATQIEINDDDSSFDDAYVETGGGQTLAKDVTVNGTLYAAGTAVENEFSLLDGGGNEVFVLRIGGENVGFAYPTGQEPASGQAFTPTVGRDGAGVDSGDGITSSERYAAIACFTPGARILTAEGPLPVERLHAGARVMTLDSGWQPVAQVLRRRVRFDGQGHPAPPIAISANAFGNGWPERQLVVSAQHRFLMLHQKHAREYLVPAMALTAMPGVRAMRGKRAVTYIHLLTPAHAVVFAEGIATETCLPGRQVLHGLGGYARLQMLGLFPAALTRRRAVAPARPILSVTRARRLLRNNALLPVSGLPRCPVIASTAAPGPAGDGHRQRS